MINLSENLLHSRQVTFITHPSIQSNAFATWLTEKLSVNVTLHNINKPLTQRLAKDSVILFDIAVSNKKLNSVWRDIIRVQADNPRLLIINSAQKYELYEMAQWPALYGVFRHDDDQSRLIEGVKAVLNGEQTAELSVMHPALYSADQVAAPTENSPLTERECEILNELRCGATNMDIARALFISENTVRTHLYNVFRKLSVKNRTQAVSWANEHLRH
ncbi:TPA: LuxR C-terminal-related transcriptional regulator [Klebsiella aerogenes]|uniref:LuxR C-terminal-related transcriptional regulator n=1 Tax=Klebsiella TaxID=570 RepID=UPI00063CA965|nr:MULTISPECIES: LuxR C-terminal-related transcriptional regulator [Klebsiella]EKW8937027.1 transcriptional regulator CsgD [Klebsiella aerogenes]KLF07095.1 XRE family transcriptional regulator [Klebsiella aerogenes]KZQ96503.1 helix-turn-helix transcriptional regulator [Klebsiella aerogenes]MBZ4209177.1 transcriptional regulator CsgD [Klebsiella aerogenes]MBZ4217608.1 transcriptional regulator CsgD [Klebsiella aerogenes]